MVANDCEMPPVAVGPKKAPNEPVRAANGSTPEKLVSPVCVQPERVPVSKPPLTTSACAGIAIANSAAAPLHARTDPKPCFMLLLLLLASHGGNAVIAWNAWSIQAFVIGLCPCRATAISPDTSAISSIGMGWHWL